MPNCSNCYNGCPDITSDQCVKYTGIDVPLLGIKNGDSLSYIEQALISFLSSALDGTGIEITIPNDIICTIVNGYLQECEDLTLVNVITALIKSICDIQEQINSVVTTLNTLNAPYATECLIGVDAFSDTHTIVQTIITALCALTTSVTELSNSINLYVPLDQLNALIQDYLDASISSTQMKNKMVPWVAMEYYNSDISGFDSTGKGFPNTIWDSVYLCNGNNGTPDKRGRVAVGAISNMGTNPMSPAVDPANAGNPHYSLEDTEGANTIVLDATMIPAHTHIATSTVDDPKHHHAEFNTDASAESDPDVTTTNYPTHRHDTETGLSYRITGSVTGPTLGLSSDASTGITVATSNANTGGGLSHSNIQPVIAAYYIIYIP